MKISEAIAQLQAIQSEFGDIVVKITDPAQIRRKAAGLPLVRNSDLETARQESAAVRAFKANANAEHLDATLRSDPDLAGLSLQKLADRLNELEFRNLSGKPWSKASVNAALQRLKSKDRTDKGLGKEQAA